MRIAKSAGSPAFMAPELCRVKHGEVSGKPADIWSMGVTLYCLRFGRVPFRKDAMLDLYSAITNDDVSLPADCSPELADLVSRILEKNPEKRIPMEELRVSSSKATKHTPWLILIRSILGSQATARILCCLLQRTAPKSLVLQQTRK